MCGRFNVIDNQAFHGLCELVGIDTRDWPIRYSDYHRACSKISIIRQSGDQRVVDDAIWWLLLEPTEGGFKPSRYTSFNTRYDKLDVPRSAGYKAYRQSRCIIPASGFGETEYHTVNGKKKPKFYHNFEAIDSAIAFGGLYREWINNDTGEITFSCSIITLPPHPKLIPYHSKASPMMLPTEREWLDKWLDPGFNDAAEFVPLLEPAIRTNLSGQEINKPA